MSSTGGVDCGKPSGSASTIVAAAASGYHLLKIDSYSLTKVVPTGERIKSRPFTVGGHLWHIDYYPNGRHSECADCISCFLVLENATKTVKAQYRLHFVDEEKKQPPWTSRPIRDFTGLLGCRGRSRFTRREILEKSKHLKDDSFTIRCDIVVINEFRAEDTNLVSAPQPFVSVPPPELHQHLGDLLKTEKGADVVFEVGGETIAAHRCVLASRSPVFRAELFGSMKEGNAAGGGVVGIQDMTAQVFKALLHFVYTELLPEMQKEEEGVMCQHLLVAADRYDLERLKLICEQKLCEYIALGTAATILTLADQHHCQGLKKACFHFLRSPANLRAVMATDDFQHMSKTCPSVMLELIALSTVP